MASMRAGARMLTECFSISEASDFQISPSLACAGAPKLGLQSHGTKTFLLVSVPSQLQPTTISSELDK